METNLQERNIASNLSRMAQRRPDLFGQVNITHTSEEGEEAARAAPRINSQSESRAHSGQESGMERKPVYVTAENDVDNGVSNEPIRTSTSTLELPRVSFTAALETVAAPGASIHPAPLGVSPPTTMAPGADALASFNESKGVNIILSIHVPLEESKVDWNLNGQRFNVALPISSLIVDTKKAISEKLGGKMPLKRFQLRHAQAGFLKDKKTLRDSGIKTGDVVMLKVRNR